MSERVSQRRSLLVWQGLAALLLAGVIFPAAADDGKPRYVAGDGRDTGDCQNRFRPCRTLSYAIAQAGKGDRIQVAEGTYSIRDSRELHDLLSVPGRINAGFTKVSGYSERNAAASTMLIGVPPEFRERFQAVGFTVIVDTKGLDISPEEAQRMRKLTEQVRASEQSHAAAPCVANLSAGFPCQSVSLLAHLSLQDLRPAGSAGNDVWGFTDLNTGREYAFMGLQNGVAILDITNPQIPDFIGSVSGSSTTWRDIKVYQRYDTAARRWRAYAYATADAVQDFLIILDLSALPNGFERVSFNTDFRAAHNAYLVNADYTFGLAQTTATPQLGVSGAALNVGNYRLYSLANPRAPQLQHVVTAGYSHDLASFPVSDARKNSQCVNAQAQSHCQVLSDFNEDTVDIWDVTNAAAPQRLSSQPYSNATYVHSGWWSEDGRYVYVHDELDELNRGLNTTLRVFDAADLRAPALAGTWVGPTRATDHNGYVKGNRYYISNYGEGLTVLDVTNPAAPTRVGYFDTFPTSEASGFRGAWGVYPFFASGTIAVGDINTGLYLLRNETLATPRGSLSMANATLSGIEGQTLTLSVNRAGGATGAVSVQLDVLHGSAGAADATLATTTLNWADGDAQPKTASLDLAGDALAEDLELLLVRLKNPQGGATIDYPETTWVTVGDAGQTTRLGLLGISAAIDDARAQALVAVTRRGSTAGEARVSFRTLGGTHAGFTPAQGELVWADGDARAKIATVTWNPLTLNAGQSATIEIEFFGAINASLENSGGTSVTTLPLTITVNDPAATQPPPPPPPPGGGGGGGGGGGVTGLALLAVLTALLGARRRFTRTWIRTAGVPARPQCAARRCWP